jgi:hypothetical protein
MEPAVIQSLLEDQDPLPELANAIMLSPLLLDDGRPSRRHQVLPRSCPRRQRPPHDLRLPLSGSQLQRRRGLSKMCVMTPGSLGRSGDAEEHIPKLPGR